MSTELSCREILELFSESKFFSKHKICKTERAKGLFELKLFTLKNVYTISIKENEERNYLGCVVSSRAPEPGEKHTRGNDLADGRLTLETFNSILLDIIFFELEYISNNDVHWETVKNKKDICERVWGDNYPSCE